MQFESITAKLDKYDLLPLGEHRHGAAYRDAVEQTGGGGSMRAVLHLATTLLPLGPASVAHEPDWRGHGCSNGHCFKSQASSEEAIK